MNLAVVTAFNFHPLFTVASITVVVTFLLALLVRGHDCALRHGPLHLGRLVRPVSVPTTLARYLFVVACSAIRIFITVCTARGNLPGKNVCFVFVTLSALIDHVTLNHFISLRNRGLLMCANGNTYVATILLLILYRGVPYCVLSTVYLKCDFNTVIPSLRAVTVRTISPTHHNTTASAFFMTFSLNITINKLVTNILVGCLNCSAVFVVVLSFYILSLKCCCVFNQHRPSSFGTNVHRITLRPCRTADTRALPLIVAVSHRFNSKKRLVNRAVTGQLGVTFCSHRLVTLATGHDNISRTAIRTYRRAISNVVVCSSPARTTIFRTRGRIVRSVIHDRSYIVINHLTGFVLRKHDRYLGVFICSGGSCHAGGVTNGCGLSLTSTRRLIHIASGRQQRRYLRFAKCR